VKKKEIKAIRRESNFLSTDRNGSKRRGGGGVVSSTENKKEIGGRGKKNNNNRCSSEHELFESPGESLSWDRMFAS